jgi:hypothetical protein
VQRPGSDGRCDVLEDGSETIEVEDGIADSVLVDTDVAAAVAMPLD